MPAAGEFLALLAWVPLALAQGGRAGAAKPAQPAEPAPYPYELYAVDAVLGHLSEGRFEEPFGVAFDSAARELYVADSRNGLIGIFDDERTPVFAFGGPALMVEPRAVHVEPDGTIYVLDAQQTELRAFDYRGQPREPLRFVRPPRAAAPPRRVAGTPAREPERESLPDELAGTAVRIGAFARIPGAGWVLADAGQARVLVYDDERRFVRELEPSPRAKSFKSVADVAVSPFGAIAAVDMQGVPVVHVWNAEGRLLAAFGERDVGLKDFTAPSAVAFDELGFLYAADLLRHDVKVFAADGRFLARFGGWFSPQSRGRGPGELLYPVDLAIDPRGTIYVAERFGQRVQAFERRPRPAAAPTRR